MSMPSRTARIAAACLALTLGVGCSSRQLYGAGQAWQRNECQRLADVQERQRCLAKADTSYEAYRRQVGGTISR